jgi:hypothetical protein
VVEDARELAGVDHAGLVDDQDDAAVEGLLAAAPGVLPAVESAGVDAMIFFASCTRSVEEA